MTLCVYALTAAPTARIAIKGVAGETLRVATAGRIAAIVGEITRLPKPDEAALRGYDRVQRALAARLSASLPARYGTTFESADELILVLSARQDTLRASLRHVRGRAQMTVRVGGGVGSRHSGFGTRDSRSLESRARSSESRVPSPEPRVPSPEARIPKPGTAYLQSRAAAHDIAGFAPLRGAVRRWVRDERVEKRSGVGSVYHLVPRASAGVYRRALEAAARDAGLRVVVSGPWPPYAFSSPF